LTRHLVPPFLDWKLFPFGNILPPSVPLLVEIGFETIPESAGCRPVHMRIAVPTRYPGLCWDPLAYYFRYISTPFNRFVAHLKQADIATTAAALTDPQRVLRSEIPFTYRAALPVALARS